MAELGKLSSQQLSDDIAAILSTADLQTVTAKKVRKQLEEKFSVDLLSRKDEIDTICMEHIIKLTSKQKKEEDKKPQTATASNGQNNSSSSESSGDSASDLDDDGPAVKKPKIKKRKTSDDDCESDDAKLAQKLQEEEDGGGRRTRHGPKHSKKTKSKKKNADDNDEKPKRKSATVRITKYNEACYLSPQLSAIVGTDRLKRSDVVKRMWEIVKERNLYDPKNKQFMICDQEMQSVFGCKRVRIFGMMKTLKNHITSPGDYEAMHG